MAINGLYAKAGALVGAEQLLNQLAAFTLVTVQTISVNSPFCSSSPLFSVHSIVQNTEVQSPHSVDQGLRLHDKISRCESLGFSIWILLVSQYLHG
jgi:hypothetical protein